MRKELYGKIKETLEAEVPEVKHIDLWNQNVEFLDEEEVWARPAVFVEFGSISWQPLQGRGRRGLGEVRIHLVTDWSEGEYGAAFDLGRKVHARLEGLQGEEFNGMTLSATATNHSHEEILENIDTYAVRYLLEE